MNIEDILPNIPRFEPWKPKGAATSTPDPNSRGASGYSLEELNAEIERRRRLREGGQ